MRILSKLKALTAEVTSLSHLIPRNRLINLLRHWEFSSVIDAGAHDGTWAKDVLPFLNLQSNPNLLLIDPITSLSPKNFEILKKFTKIQSHALALGSESKSAAFHIASNSGESSSFMEFSNAHLGAAPEVFFEEIRNVSMVPLDLLADSLLGPILLKLDLQGYEIEALKGAKNTLSKVEVLVIEASLVEAYIGGSTLKSLISYLEPLGFSLVGLVESFSEKNYGKMIQMDAIFARNSIT